VTAVVWGPVATWAGVVATLLVVITTALVALGYFDFLRGPRLRLTFETSEPWCRQGKTRHGEPALWVRVGVENLGAGRARGCLGRLIAVASDDEVRRDVDPVQLRWAGMPRSLAFHAMDVRRGQREYLKVLCLRDGSRWRLVTFEDPDFDPGFVTDLPIDERHVIRISVFADNADTVTRSLVAEAQAASEEVKLQLVSRGRSRRPEPAADTPTT
jgi:hypothetical protein